jgi:hypothetical protein
MIDEMKCPIGYTFTLRIPFHLLQCWYNTCTNTITNDMVHFISSCDLIGSSILTSLALHRCIGPSAPSLCSSIPPCGPALQSLQLALHSCNWSIKPSLILIFSTLVTWLHVMSHMQLAPSSHVPMTNLLCISHKHLLVHLSCHSITKTKQEPFTTPQSWSKKCIHLFLCTWAPRPFTQKLPSPLGLRPYGSTSKRLGHTRRHDELSPQLSSISIHIRCMND